MTFAELVSSILLISALLLIVRHHIRRRRERMQPTLRHRLFACHLTSVLQRTR
jgi:hypothetical protein